jgi:hypothetical protein
LKTKLCSSIHRDGPKQYHDRFGLFVPPENSKLQMQLNHLSDFANNHFMKINTQKAKIFPFNFKRSFDFLPVLTLPGNSEPLQVVYSTKLLGVICSSDGKWHDNTSYIVKRATSKLCMLRRLKWIGADQEILLETYTLHSNLFPVSIGPNTRNKSTFNEYNCITPIYYKSAIPYLTRLLNGNEKKIEFHKIKFTIF